MHPMYAPIQINTARFYSFLFHYTALHYTTILYLSRKYDTNNPLDRSGTSSYPDGYISSILARSACTARGVSSTEHKAYAANKGYKKGRMLGMYRPRAIDLRYVYDCALSTCMSVLYM